MTEITLIRLNTCLQAVHSLSGETLVKQIPQHFNMVWLTFNNMVSSVEEINIGYVLEVQRKGPNRTWEHKAGLLKEGKPALEFEEGEIWSDVKE